MSTSKTENLNLHQWSPQDPISLREVNANFTALDTALAAEVGAREGAVETVEGALAEHLSTPDFVYGSYTGTGAAQEIELGFRPKLVFISGETYISKTDTSTRPGDHSGMFYPGGLIQVMHFLDNGFKVNKTNYYPDLITQDRTFRYLAFR